MTTVVCPTAHRPSLSRGVARQKLRSLQKRHLDGPGRLITYPCPVCHLHHLGHHDNRMRKAS